MMSNINPDWTSNGDPNARLKPVSGVAPRLLAAAAPGGRAISFEVVRESPWWVFVTSVRDAFTGPPAPKATDVSGGPELRVHWIRGRAPGKPFLASWLWHVATVLILILPIW